MAVVDSGGLVVGLRHFVQLGPHEILLRSPERRKSRSQRPPRCDDMRFNVCALVCELAVDGDIQ